MKSAKELCIASGGSSVQDVGISSLSTGVKYKISHTPSSITVGSTKASHGSGTNATGTGRNILLFAASNAGNTAYAWTSFGKGKIYSFKIYEGDVPVRNFIPCKNASGTVGMFDIITQTFYTNSGSGTFTAGPELYSQAYTALEYIEATGTQYIKTGVVGGAKWEFDIQFTNLTTRQLMGYGGSGTEYWGVQTDGTYGLATWSHINVQAGNRDTIIHTYGTKESNNLNVVGKGRLGLSSTDVSSKQYQIFAIEGGYLCNAKLYRCKAYDDDGTLIRDFIPCKSASGAVGLYDLVNNKFYGNSGSGTFGAGEAKDVMGFTTTNGSSLVAGQTSVTVSYTENGVTCTDTQAVTVSKVTISTTPSQSGTLTYNGSSQTSSWNNYNSSQLTIGGTTSATNAGTYTATFTPKAYHQWSDGTTGSKSISWSIGKANGSVTLSSTSGTIKYKESVSITVSKNTSGGTLSTATSNSNVASASVSGTTIKISSTNTVGTATITVTSAATTNYNAASATYSLTVNKANGSITLSSTSGTASYADGGSFSISSNVSGGTLSVSSSNSNIAGATLNGTTVTLTPGTETVTNIFPQGTIEDSSAWSGATFDTTTAYQGSTSLKLTGTSVPQSSIDKPIVGHKYYAREYIKTSGANNPADCRFEIYGGDGTGLNWVFGWNTGNFSSWTMISGVVTIDCLNASSYVIRTFVVNASNTTWIDGIMMVDLTAMFGAGNEPDQTWCDTYLPDITDSTTIPCWGLSTTITVTSAATTNYTAATATYKVTVEKGTLKATVSNYTGTYDGAAHSITVTNTQGATITYATSANGTYSSTKPTYTNAGTYTTYYKLTKYGCDTVTGSGTVTINKVTTTISLSSTSASINYGYTASTTVTTNSPGAITVTSANANIATASVSGKVVTITPGGVLGSTTISIYIAESTNYTASSTLTFTITVSVPVGAYITYSANSYTNWRIMFNTSSAIQVISNGSVGTYTLSGNGGYIRAVQYLNAHAQNWLNTTYAVSARCVGCTSSSVADIGSGAWDMSGDPYSDSHYSTDVNQLVNNGLVQTDTTVFLASRYEHGLSWGSDGCVRTLTTSGSVDWESLQEYYLTGMQNDSDVTLGFRPVVTLKSNLKFTGGNGTSSSPYTFTTY